MTIINFKSFFALLKRKHVLINVLITLFLFMGTLPAITQNVTNRKEKVYQDGTKSTTIYYDNGNYAIITEMPCISCKGSGVCSFCNGHGLMMADNKMVRCTSCVGLKTCALCGGAGKNSSCGLYDSSGNQISGFSTLDNISTQQQSSQPQQQTMTKTCTSCGGTGLVPNSRVDQTVRIMGGQDHMCQQCGKKHASTSHESCVICQGTGRK